MLRDRRPSQYVPAVRLRVHDPGHIALRRGIRAAVAIPATMVVALYVIPEPVGLVFALFGVTGLIVSADFAGSWQRRSASYLLTGIAGTAVIALGWAADSTVVTAVLATVVIGFALAFVGLLRGKTAAAVPPLQLLLVVVVSVPGGPDVVGHYILGWWIAVVVATVTALVVLPRTQVAGLREELAVAFEGAAQVVRTRWRGGSSPEAGAAALDHFGRAVDRLDREYGGKPYRPTGSTRSDRALQLLVFHINSARLLLTGPQRESATPDDDFAERSALAAATDDGLSALADAMRDPTRVPSGKDIDSARVQMRVGMEKHALAAAQRGVPTKQIAEDVRRDHTLRLGALFVEEMVALARLANGAPPEDLPGQPPPPRRTLRMLLQSQLSWSSPWVRNALRGSLGLGLAVLVVQLGGFQRGFWVLLGVISILRFDAVGTRKYAWQALLGTVLGVVITSAVLEVASDAEWLIWSLVPVMAFLAAWAGPAVSFPFGQAAFTSMVLVALAVVNWPPNLGLGLVRIEDIAAGALVAVIVATVMWPRGAAGELRRRIAAALTTASGFFGDVLQALTHPANPDTILQERWDSAHRVEQAVETYDLALMQRGVALDDADTWRAATSAVVSGYLLAAAGRVLAQYVGPVPLVRGMPGLAAAIEDARNRSSTHWREVADAVQSGHATGTVIRPLEPEPIDVHVVLHTPEDAHAFVVGVWSVSWVDHLDRLGYASAQG